MLPIAQLWISERKSGMGPSKELSERVAWRTNRLQQREARALPRKEQVSSQGRKAFIQPAWGAGAKRERLLRGRVSKEPRKDPPEFSQAQRATCIREDPPAPFPLFLPCPSQFWKHQKPKCQ